MSRTAVIFCMLGLFSGGLLAGPHFEEGVNRHPVPARFSVCHGYGCEQIEELGLSATQWNQVQELFTPPPATPAEERLRMADAVAILEVLVGEMTGTSRDIAGTFGGMAGPGQMDCIDESTNTTVYLLMLTHQALLRWHTVERRATRGWFLFGWPHTTAVVRDNATGRLHAVDSWFLDNGERPFILPLEEWKDGWEPD